MEADISYDEESFNKAAPIYQKALNNSGYTHNLTFSPQTPSQPACSWKEESEERNNLVQPPIEQKCSHQRWTSLSQDP